MIVWHGQWPNRTPPGIYRIRFDATLKGGLFIVEMRRAEKDKWEQEDGWKQEKATVSPNMAEWHGILHLYDVLELLA